MKTATISRHIGIQPRLFSSSHFHLYPFFQLCETTNMSESQPVHRRSEPGLFEPLLMDITKREIHLNPAFHDRRTPQRRSTDGLEHILASVNLHLHAGT